MSKAVYLLILVVLRRSQIQTVQQLWEYSRHPKMCPLHCYLGSPASFGKWQCPKTFSRSDWGQFKKGYVSNSGYWTFLHWAGVWRGNLGKNLCRQCSCSEASLATMKEARDAGRDNIFYMATVSSGKNQLPFILIGPSPRLKLKPELSV